MTDHAEPSNLGWHVISGEHLLESLRRAARGEQPDVLFAEMWANADHEMVEVNEKRVVRCSSCNAKCRWVDDAWVCVRGGCRAEWYPDHGDHFRAPWQPPSSGGAA